MALTMSERSPAATTRPAGWAAWSTPRRAAPVADDGGPGGVGGPGGGPGGAPGGGGPGRFRFGRHGGAGVGAELRDCLVGVVFLAGAAGGAVDAGIHGGDGGARAEAGVVAVAAARGLVADVLVAAGDAGGEAAEGAAGAARAEVPGWSLGGGEGEEGGGGVDC